MPAAVHIGASTTKMRFSFSRADGKRTLSSSVNAQCVVTRGQAEDLLRLVRRNADDAKLVIQLNAQYASMIRTALSVQDKLVKIQTVRQKRAKLESSANQDAWTLHIAERSMLEVADPDPNAGSHQATWPEAAQAAAMD